MSADANTVITIYKMSNASRWTQLWNLIKITKVRKESNYEPQ